MPVVDEWLDTSVTALKVVNLRGEISVLAGIGNQVELWTENEVKIRKEVLSGTNAVHGFKDVHGGSFACFGGKELCLFSQNFEVKGTFSCPDWIIDVFFGQNDQILVLTSHNRILQCSHLKLSEEIACLEKCILYSGLIVNDPTLGLAVLSGTVFQEVVVWCPSSGRVHHRLKGHEGVLFSIIYDETNKYICSTSDDRTGRIWAVRSGSCWADSSVELKHSLRDQHSSRIFCASFFRFRSQVFVATFGEDSSICIWKIDDEALPVKKFNHDHMGCPIWSGDVFVDNDHVRIYTGGLNAAIRVFHFTPIDNNDPKMVKIPCDEVEYPRSLLQLQSSVICLTNAGSVFAIEDGTVTKLLHDDTLFNYAAMGFDKVSNTLIFGNLTGDVVLYDVSGCFKHRKRIHDGKISTLISLEHLKILTLGSNRVIKITDISNFCTIATLRLPKCGSKKFQQVFCALMVEDFLIVGEREGSIHLFRVGEELPIFSLSKIHGPNGCCDIKYFNKVIWTAGRDGTVRKFLVGPDLRQISVRRLRSSWLEKIEFTSTGKALTLGFHSTSFLVIDLEEDIILWRVECGGCHRSWTFQHWEDAMKTFFIKDGRVFRSFTKDFKTLLRSPVHSHDISCVHHFKVCGRHLLATSGDDTTIKIHEVKNGTRRTLTTLTGHISTVKSISSHESTLVSVGGRAQMIVWAIRAVGDDVCGTPVSNHLLKGGDKARMKKVHRQGEESLVFDPETRYMDVAVSPSDDCLRVGVSCSDGCLRVFSVNERGVGIICQSDVHSHALMKIISAEKDSSFYVSSTDGHVYKDEFELISQFHQSGINAMCMNDQKICTGGDDGAICVKTRDKMLKYPMCHSSTITGLHCLDDDTLISVSIDQRVSIWKIIGDKLELTDQHFCNIPDVQSSVIWDDNGKIRMAIVGAGLQIFTLSWANINAK